MDLHYSQTMLQLPYNVDGFTTLWIYTILKLRVIRANVGFGFTTLWIYTILKPVGFLLYLMNLFHYLMDLHYSQTLYAFCIKFDLFHYLMDLHYSQTVSCV